MPLLNWDAFANLPGSAETNFENLCRHLIRRHYSKFGLFAALASQPGVEFHLKLHTACSLGKEKDWYGWQCRWYTLPSGRAIGQTRRDKIKAAIQKTEKYLPNLTHFVLWTRYPLTANDQKWFFGLKTKFKLILWDAKEVEEHLSGEATIFRSTYFGELVLTPEILESQHRICVAPIRLRWQSEAHQIVDAERDLRRMLGETEAWEILDSLSEDLRLAAQAVSSSVCDLPDDPRQSCNQFVAAAVSFSERLSEAFLSLKHGDLDILQQVIAPCSTVLDPSLGQLPRKLRALRHKAALPVTNGIADIRAASKLLGELGSSVGKRIICIVADAGCGKTQLSAQVTSTEVDRPAGVFLRGRDLAAGASLDDLARKIVISATPIPSMEALLAALDAAGQRAHRRLPLSIDGLNEAEDPRNWKALISSASEVLQQYPYVLLICTLRTAFVEEAIPEKVDRLEIPDFGRDSYSAIQKYFEHYKINPTDAQLPFGLLCHPLTLRLFCEVTNPKREQTVGIEAMPGSLTTLFDRYIEQASDRIAVLSSSIRRYYAAEVRDALDEIGIALWEGSNRDLDLKAVRTQIGDLTRPWNDSIIRALEDEGILLREPGDRVAGVYDALSGHLIANAMLSRRGPAEFETWLKAPQTNSRLIGDLEGRHPLAADTLRAIVGLSPKFHHRQLWSVLEDPLRSAALRIAAESEGKDLDATTVDELSKLVFTRFPDSRRFLLDRLRELRGAVGHPLNAGFLDDVLHRMDLPDRDLLWTEWIRERHDEVVRDIRRLHNRWRKSRATWPNSEPERLRARWVMWYLSSTVRKIRDEATRTLYWFGRGDPSGFLRMAIRTLAINDPYVSERMLAAAYGTCMALHCRPGRSFFKSKVLPAFARDVYSQMFAPSAPSSTTHALARDYGRRILELAELAAPSLFTSEERMRFTPPYKEGGIRTWQVMNDPGEGRYREGNSPLGLDFANCTIGRLVPERHTYDFDHAEYKRVVGQIVWRIYQLGYSIERFGEIDRHIANIRYAHRSERPPAERYGKKYAWIAYFEQYGIRQDEGLLEHSWRNEEVRCADADIDPSFPEAPFRLRLIDDILGNRSTDTGNWVKRGPSPEFGSSLLQAKVSRLVGPWLLLHGYRSQRDKAVERIGFVNIQSLLVLREDSEECLELLKKHSFEGQRLPGEVEDDLTFAGEIPWCDTFQPDVISTLDFVVDRITVEVSPDDPRFNLPAIVIDFGGSKRTIGPTKPPKFEEKNLYKRIPVYIPFRKTRFSSGGGIDRPNAEVPGRKIANHFGLWLDLPTWNFRDSSGRLSSITTSDGENWDYESHLFFRRELLDEFLESHDLQLIWIVEGERQHFGERHMHGSNAPTHGYKRFRQVYFYTGPRVRRIS